MRSQFRTMAFKSVNNSPNHKEIIPKPPTKPYDGDQISTMAQETKEKYARFLNNKSKTKSLLYSPLTQSQNTSFLTKKTSTPTTPTLNSNHLVALIQKAFVKKNTSNDEQSLSTKNFETTTETIERIKTPQTTGNFFESPHYTTGLLTKNEEVNRHRGILSGKELLKRVTNKRRKNKSINEDLSRVISPNRTNRPCLMDIKDKNLSIEIPFTMGSPIMNEKSDESVYKELKKDLKKNFHFALNINQPDSFLQTTNDHTLSGNGNYFPNVKVYNRNPDALNHLARTLSPFCDKKPRSPSKQKNNLSRSKISFHHRVITSSPISKNCFGRSATANTSPNYLKLGKNDSRIYVLEDFEPIEQSSFRIQPILKKEVSEKISNEERVELKFENETKDHLNKEVPIELSKMNEQEGSEQIQQEQNDQTPLGNKKNELEYIIEPKKIEERKKIQRKEKLDEILFRFARSETKEFTSLFDVNINKTNVIKEGSHAKLKISSDVMSEEVTRTKEEIQNLEEKFKDVQEQNNKSIYQYNKNRNYSSENKTNLTEFQVQLVQKEYEKKDQSSEAINYENIDNVLSNLKFFLGLPKHVRLKLLQNATFVHYPSSGIIYNEGDLSDKMYIIIRGSVNIRKKARTSYGSIEKLIVATLYDGQYFGDCTNYQKKKTKPKLEKFSREDNKHESQQASKQIASKVYPEKHNHLKFENVNLLADGAGSLQDTSRRGATMEAAEPCDILSIPNNKFQKILSSLIQKELEDRIRVLSGLPFFDKSDPFALIPLANNLTVKTYKMGEAILAAGDKVDKFQIVSKGKCKLVCGVLRKSNLEPPITLHGRTSSTKHFRTGTVDYSCQPPVTRQKSSGSLSLRRGQSFSMKSSHQKLHFNCDKIDVQDNHLLYMQQLPIATLFQGDFFGGRALLTEHDFNLQGEKSKIQHMIGLPAQISVVAETASLEVFEIGPEEMKFLPDSLTRRLKQGLKNVPEFDDYDIKNILEKDKKWAEFSDRELENIFKYKTKPYGATYKKF